MQGQEIIVIQLMIRGKVQKHQTVEPTLETVVGLKKDSQHSNVRIRFMMHLSKVNGLVMILHDRTIMLYKNHECRYQLGMAETFPRVQIYAKVAVLPFCTSKEE